MATNTEQQSVKTVAFAYYMGNRIWPGPSSDELAAFESSNPKATCTFNANNGSAMAAPNVTRLVRHRLDHLGRNLDQAATQPLPRSA